MTPLVSNVLSLPADVTTPFYDALLEDDVDTLRDLLEKTPTLVRTLYTEAAYYPDTEASAVRFFFVYVLALTAARVGFAARSLDRPAQPASARMPYGMPRMRARDPKVLQARGRHPQDNRR